VDNKNESRVWRKVVDREEATLDIPENPLKDCNNNGQESSLKDLKNAFDRLNARLSHLETKSKAGIQKTERNLDAFGLNHMDFDVPKNTRGVTNVIQHDDLEFGSEIYKS